MRIAVTYRGALMGATPTNSATYWSSGSPRHPPCARCLFYRHGKPWHLRQRCCAARLRDAIEHLEDVSRNLRHQLPAGPRVENWDSDAAA